jgi:hypothetical protein
MKIEDKNKQEISRSILYSNFQRKNPEKGKKEKLGKKDQTPKFLKIVSEPSRNISLLGFPSMASASSNELPEIVKKLAVNKQNLNNAIGRRTTAFGNIAKMKMELALAQKELAKAERKYKTDDIVKNLEFLQEQLENAKQQCLEQNHTARFQRLNSSCFPFPANIMFSSCFFIASLIFIALPILASFRLNTS